MNRREFVKKAAVTGISVLACGLACASEEKQSDEKFVCVRIEGNKKQCTCKNKRCKHYGICCDCVRNHRAQKNLPACLKPEK